MTDKPAEQARGQFDEWWASMPVKNGAFEEICRCAWDAALRQPEAQAQQGRIFSLEAHVYPGDRLDFWSHANLNNGWDVTKAAMDRVATELHRILREGPTKCPYAPGHPEAQASSAPMTLERAREIMKDEIQPDGGLYCLGHYLAWTPGEFDICLDDRFSLDELEAIITIMRASNTDQRGSAAQEPRRTGDAAASDETTVDPHPIAERPAEPAQERKFLRAIMPYLTDKLVRPQNPLGVTGRGFHSATTIAGGDLETAEADQTFGGMRKLYCFAPTFRWMLLSFGVASSCCINTGANANSPRTDTSAFAASWAPGSALGCTHTCTPTEPANNIVADSWGTYVQPASYKASCNWLLKFNASGICQYVVTRYFCPANLFTFATINCRPLGPIERGALNCSSARYAFAASAFASSARSFAFAVSRPNCAACSLVAAIFSSNALWSLSATSYPTKAEINANSKLNTPRDAARIVTGAKMVSKACSEKAPIALLLISAIFLVICIAAIIAGFVFLLIAQHSDRVERLKDLLNKP